MPALPERNRIRAPRGHGVALVDPPLDAAAGLLAANRALAAGCDPEIYGVRLAVLRQEARRELLRAAVRYTAAYRDAADADPARPIILAGHQPQLFHAGVWFKNFALSALGQRLNATAVNLLIDNDILQSVSIRVPCRDGQAGLIESVAFDRPAEPIPYEERSILDADLFAAFGQNVEAALGKGSGVVFGPRGNHGGCAVPENDSRPAPPLIRRLWPLALEAARRSSNIGRCLAEARHRLEADWQQQTLEVPLSTVCDSRPFRHFLCHLLAELPRLHGVYNACLREHRRAQRIRSRAHPVPDLATEGPWREAPFWIWTAASPARRRLFVRPVGAGLELTDRQQWQATLALPSDRDATAAVEQLQAWAAQGVRLRPRALITTMYARLVLSDLFLHGIGGAKYDHLTDQIVAQFLGRQPPAFMTLSATALLFPDRTPLLREQLRGTRRLLRELKYHPERYLPPGAEGAAAIAQKRRWIETTLPRGQRRERHVALARLNDELAPLVAAQREDAVRAEARGAEDLRGAALRASREFSFCLFSEKMLCPLLLDLSGAPATLM